MRATPTESNALSAAPQRPSRALLPWIVWLLLGLAGSSGLARLHVDNSLDAWVPHRLAGTDMGSYLIVGFETRETPITAVRKALADLPQVGFCLDPDAPFFEPLLKTTPRGLLRSADGDYAGILCIASPGTAPARLAGAVRTAMDTVSPAPQSGYAIAGPAAFAAALNDYTRRRMGLVVTLIMLVGGVLMGMVTRSTKQALQTVAAISLAMVILLGAIGWSGVRVDMSMLLVPPMMISMGFSYAAHAALRRDASRVLLLCALTTILGVIFFSTSGVPSIRSFALWGAIGVALVWACVLCLVGGPAPAQPRLKIRSPMNRNYRRLIYALAGRSRTIILLIGAAVALLAPFGAGRLTVNPQPLNYFPPDAPIVRDNATIEARLTGMLPFEIITDNPEAARSIVGESRLVRAIADITAIRAGGADPGEHLLWCTSNNEDLDALRGAFDDWSARARGRGVSIAFRGVAAQLLELRHQMKRIAVISIPSMLLVAAVVCALIAGDMRAGWAGLIVNLLPVSAVLLAAEVAQIPMQLPTLMVGAIGIGAGIDDTIHILWLDRRASTPEMLRTCLVPCSMSSLIASAGMALFAFSPFSPTAQFGLLMAIILLIASLSNLVLLPIFQCKQAYYTATSPPIHL